MQLATSSQEHAVLLTRGMIRGSRDYLKTISGVQKCCACVAKPSVVTIERVTSKNSVTRDSIKELWKTVEMDPRQSIGKLWKRQSTLLQPIEDFERFSIVLLHMNKQRKVCLLLSKKNSRRRWNTHKVLTPVSFDNSFSFFSIFIHSN